LGGSSGGFVFTFIEKTQALERKEAVLSTGVRRRPNRGGKKQLAEAGKKESIVSENNRQRRTAEKKEGTLYAQ